MAADATTTTLSLERFAPDAKALVVGAQALADERKHVEVQPLHLLARGLERDPGVAEVFRHAGANVMELSSSVERALGELPHATEPAYLSAAMLDLLERAQRESERDRAGSVQVEHLLNALSQEIRGPAGEILGAFALGPGLAQTPRGGAAPGRTAAQAVRKWRRKSLVRAITRAIWSRRRGPGRSTP